MPQSATEAGSQHSNASGIGAGGDRLQDLLRYGMRLSDRQRTEHQVARPEALRTRPDLHHASHHLVAERKRECVAPLAGHVKA